MTLRLSEDGEYRISRHSDSVDLSLIIEFFTDEYRPGEFDFLFQKKGNFSTGCNYFSIERVGDNIFLVNSLSCEEKECVISNENFTQLISLWKKYMRCKPERIVVIKKDNRILFEPIK